MSRQSSKKQSASSTPLGDEFFEAYQSKTSTPAPYANLEDDAQESKAHV